MKSHRIPFASLVAYGFMAFPIAFAGLPLYILAPDFFATQRGLSLTLLGSILLALRIFDAVQDPIIGWIIDKFHMRLVPIASGAGAILCLSVFALFRDVLFSPALWFAVFTFFAVSSYSVLTILLGAQATLWTNDKDEQTRIAGVREAFGLAGLITAVSLPIGLALIVKPGHVYSSYAGILAVLMFLALVAFAKMPRGRSESDALGVAQPTSMLPALQALPTESIKLFAVYALSMLASSMPAVLVIFYVRDLLGAEPLTGLFLMLYFVAGALGMPFWKKLSEDMGKYSVWMYANLLAVAGFCGAIFLQPGDIWPYSAFCTMSGFALGGDLTLPPSILADQIHARGNTAFSATHYSLLAFVSKASLAIASAIALPALDAAGFRPQAANSAHALLMLSAAYALIPSLLKFTAAGFLYFFFVRSHRGDHHETITNLADHRSDLHA
ncbi:MAG: MFS transporter [Pseudomonadota bacterium]|nr:MFS transporter [Pseudomonadota bacterium]